MANKTWILTGAVVIAAVVAFLAIRGNRVGTPGTEGTIGAANRYQSEQITGADVSLDDPTMASFIQSDTFRKLASSAEFRQAIKSEDFQQALRSEPLLALLQEGLLTQVLENRGVQTLLESASFKTAAPALGEALSVREFSRAAKEPAMVQFLEQGWVRELAGSDAFNATALEAANRKARTAEEIRSIAATQEGLQGFRPFEQLLAQKNLGELLNMGALELLSRRELAQQVTSAEFISVLKEPSFKTAIDQNGFVSLTEALSKRPESIDALVRISKSPEQMAGLSLAPLAEAARSREFRALAAAPPEQLTRALDQAAE
jgi:hypothetical protein